MLIIACPLCSYCIVIQANFTCVFLFFFILSSRRRRRHACPCTNRTKFSSSVFIFVILFWLFFLHSYVAHFLFSHLLLLCIKLINLTICTHLRKENNAMARAQRVRDLLSWWRVDSTCLWIMWSNIWVFK